MNTIEEIKEAYQKRQDALGRARKGEITFFDAAHIDLSFKAKAVEYVAVLLEKIDSLTAGGIVTTPTQSVTYSDSDGIIISIEAIGNPGERRHPAPCQFPEYLCVCGMTLPINAISPAKYKVGQRVKAIGSFYDGIEGIITKVERTALSWFYTVDCSAAYAKGEADYPTFEPSEEYLELVETLAPLCDRCGKPYDGDPDTFSFCNACEHDLDEIAKDRKAMATINETYGVQNVDYPPPTRAQRPACPKRKSNLRVGRDEDSRDIDPELWRCSDCGYLFYDGEDA
jgi:hypothetical protein